MQLTRQSRIIEALVRRATRQNEVGLSAYQAFQSTIELQEQVVAQTRDLELAANELEALRYDQERIRTSLDGTLAAMEDGFAMFADRKLAVCNDLFRNLFSDISFKIEPGLLIEDYLDLVTKSRRLQSLDQPLDLAVLGAWSDAAPQDPSAPSVVMELTQDRWFQLRVQRMRHDRLVILISEITAIVRQNRDEKETLIDAQADYLQAAFENVQSGVCTFSDAGDVTMFNGPFRELLGLPAEVLQKGASFSRILDVMRQHGELPQRSLAQLRRWRQAMDDDEPFRARIEQNRRRVLDLRANRLPDGGFLLELRDVTLETEATATLERRVEERTAALTLANDRLTEQYEAQAQVEEELRLAKEHAEAAVSSKTRFLAAASHDLLQPINAAKLMIDILGQDTAGGALESQVQRLNKAFQSAEQILHALLDISRLETPGPGTIRASEVHLGSLMQGVFDDQQALAAQRGIDLRLVPSSAVAMTDPIYMLRSLQNFVVNAIQYNRPGGRVLIGCRHRGDKVLLQVWDTGPGIEPAEQERIFEAFARGQAAGAEEGGPAGVGLGLSVVDRACRHLGHRLWLRSEPQKGSMFCIEMTCVKRYQPLWQPKPATVPWTTLPVGVVALVVENDEDVLFATTNILERWGVDVLAARTSDEALTHIAEIGVAPDIVLADYQLDRGDTGLAVVSRVNEATKTEVPAVLITANRDESVFEEAQRLGVAVLTKPVQTGRLRTLMEAKLEGRARLPDLNPQGVAHKDQSLR